MHWIGEGRFPVVQHTAKRVVSGKPKRGAERATKPRNFRAKNEDALLSRETAETETGVADIHPSVIGGILIRGSRLQQKNL